MTGAGPKLGFVGTGWIGLNRLQAVVDQGLARVFALFDVDREASARAKQLVPGAVVCESFEDILSQDLDGLVIATPSAQHAAEACMALERKLSVFCQKPLARSHAETEQVVQCARRADRLLAVDFSYRHTAALRKIKGLIDSGSLGDLYHGRFVFHNAYGPDKAWYRDRSLSGGGCVIDLGIHWLDTALWLLDDPAITRVASRLFAQGKPLPHPPASNEDFALVQLETRSGCVLDLACSWNLPAGRDAVISVELYGTAGGAALHNVGGSFYDFRAEHWRGTQSIALTEPPDAWGGRALTAWVEQLSRSPRFDPAAQALTKVAELLDRIYLGR